MRSNGLWMDYIRTMRTGFTVPTDTEYYLLRMAVRLYAENNYKTDDATLTTIGEESVASRNMYGR